MAGTSFNTNKSSGSVKKPELSLATIINMSMGFMGIQMAFGLQNGNASRILANFGADVHELSWFWLVAPFTGLLVQPLIGHFGDHTWTWLGRRKPYFLVGAVLASLGLIFLPNSSILAGESLSASEFMGISAILWIGVAFLALMDASINVAMEPFRALVGDLLPKKQGTLGFSVQTVLIGIGAVIGSFLPYVLTNWFGVSNDAAAGHVAPNVVWSFYIGAFVLMATIIYTISTTKEYSPEEFRKYNDSENNEIEESSSIWNIFKDIKNMPLRMKRLGWVQFFSWFGLFTMWVFTTIAISQNAYDVELDTNQYNSFIAAIDKVDKNGLSEEELENFDKKLESIKKVKAEDGKYFINSDAAAFFGQNTFISENDLLDKVESSLINDNSEEAKILIAKISELKTKKIKKGENIIVPFEMLNHTKDKLNFPNKETVFQLKRISNQHQKGGDWTGILFSVYNFVALFYAFLIPLFAKFTSRKFVHMFSLILGGLGLLSMIFIHNPDYLIVSMIGIGLAWASILSMPYALLIDSLPLHKMGIYMGIFNFFIVIPQIINGLFGGPIVRSIFNDYAIYYLGIGGIFFIIAAILTLRVNEPLFGEYEILQQRENQE